MKSLLVEGESELSVFSMLCGGIDRQLHVEAESRETKLGANLGQGPGSPNTA